MFVRTEEVRYYRDSLTVNFDIIIDYLKLFWAERATIAFIDFKLWFDGERLDPRLELRLKGMIDSVIGHCDGSIPLTSLQMQILIGKVKSIRNRAARDMGGEPTSEEES